MSGLDNKVLEKIRGQGIKPIPRWHFIARCGACWIAFTLSFVFGAIAFGVALFQVTNFEWSLFDHFRDSPAEFVFAAVPVLWLLFLAVFLVMAILNFRKTPKGYRYTWWAVGGTSLAASVVFGSVLYISGFSSYLEDVFRVHIPAYCQLQEHREAIWMHPERGLLMGTIVEVNGDRNMMLKDVNGKPWQIVADGATWRGRMAPRIGLKLRAIGRKDGEARFVADEFRPWPGEGPGWRGRGMGGRHGGRP